MKDSPEYVVTNDEDHVVAFTRGDLLFVFNFHPTKSFTDYGIKVPSGTYRVILSTDDVVFGGFDRVDSSMDYIADNRIKLYLPTRCALILRRK